MPGDSSCSLGTRWANLDALIMCVHLKLSNITRLYLSLKLMVEKTKGPWEFLGGRGSERLWKNVVFEMGFGVTPTVGRSPSREANSLPKGVGVGVRAACVFSFRGGREESDG